MFILIKKSSCFSFKALELSEVTIYLFIYSISAGQWARALCINDSLDVGAILGYLSKAIKAGFAVIVFNPNLNYQPLNLEDARPKYSGRRFQIRFV